MFPFPVYRSDVMRVLSLLIIVGLIGLAFVAGSEPSLHAQVADGAKLSIYYPGVATYTPERMIGARESTAIDTPYLPAPRQARVQFANYADYAGDYAAGDRPGCRGCYQQQPSGGCCSGDGDTVFYGWNGNGFPIARAGLRVGARVVTFPLRACRRLLGGC